MELEIGNSFFEDDEGEAELDACSPKENKHQNKEGDEYVVKKVGPLWFDEEVSDSRWLTQVEAERLRDGDQRNCIDEQEGLLSQTKAKADWSFYVKDYCTAAQLYESALQVVPAHNRSVWRQVTDSLSRCHYHLGDFPTALRYAVDLVAPPHCEDASSWQLLASIHEGMLNVKDALICQQRVVVVQNGRPGAWIKLSRACTNYLRSLSDSDSEKDSNHYLELSIDQDVTFSMDGLLAKFFPKVLRNMDSFSSTGHVINENRHCLLVDVTSACSLLWARHLLTSISIQANSEWKQVARQQLEELQGEIDRFALKDLLRSVQKYVPLHLTSLPSPTDIAQ